MSVSLIACLSVITPYTTNMAAGLKKACRYLVDSCESRGKILRADMNCTGTVGYNGFHVISV